MSEWWVVRKRFTLIECIFVIYKVLCVLSFNHHYKIRVSQAECLSTHPMLHGLHETELVYKSTLDSSTISLPNQMQRRLLRRGKLELKPKERRPFLAAETMHG